MATTTYEPIQTQTLGSAAATVTFSSIPQTYTDLILVVSGGISSGQNFLLQFNGDTGSNYSDTRIVGNGSSAASYRSTSQTAMIIGNIYSGQGNIILQIQNYTNTTTYKTVLSRVNYAANLTSSHVGLWRGTPAAITSLVLSLSGDNFAAGSTFTLYGIANADSGAKATGGVITYDNTYYYHTFGASGTFTPKQNLTNVDYLVIAGGGSGASNDGAWDEGEGGGGAGGLRSTVDVTGGGGTLESKISLTSSTAYTITVGAGGAANTGNATGVNGSNSSIAGSGLTTITSVGGGGGANYGASANNGGSGGGAGGWSATNNGTGTANQGYAGGNNTGSGRGGGGGGAGSVGATGITTGNGGAGVAIPSISNITGTGVATYYAGGGGGGGRRYAETSAGAGGSGGGGTGGTGASSGTAGAGGNGVTNTGSGGGGGGATGPNPGKGGNGGSGLVVIRYAK